MLRLPGNRHDAPSNWPRADAAAARGQACGDDSGYREHGTSPDLEVAWLNLETGEVRDDPSVLAHLGDREVARSSDRSIRVGQEQVIPGSCDAEIYMVSENPLRIIATCTATTPRAPVEMFGPGFHVVLGGATKARGETPEMSHVDSPYFCVLPTSCFALQDGHGIPLRGTIQRIIGTTLITKENGQLFLVDGVTGIARPVSGLGVKSVAGHTQRLVLLGSALVDLGDDHVLGYFEGELVAVDAAGRGLVANPPSPDHGDLRLGPLRWVAPSSPDGRH